MFGDFAIWSILSLQEKKWAGLVDYEYLLTMFLLSSTKKGWVFMAKTLYKSTNQWENGIAGFRWRMTLFDNTSFVAWPWSLLALLVESKKKTSWAPSWLRCQIPVHCPITSISQFLTYWRCFIASKSQIQMFDLVKAEALTSHFSMFRFKITVKEIPWFCFSSPENLWHHRQRIPQIPSQGKPMGS